MFNRVSLTGHLVREMELKKTAGGISYGFFSRWRSRGAHGMSRAIIPLTLFAPSCGIKRLS